MKVNKLKIILKKESILIGGITALAIYQGCVIYNFKAIDKKINENVIEMDIPYEDFHSMPTLVTIIPEGVNTQSYIVRGDNRRKAIAFEAYKDDKSICYFEGYKTDGTMENFIYTEEFGVLVINDTKDTMDNIRFDTGKPILEKSIAIENLDKFIGIDSSKNYVFAINESKDIFCCNVKSGVVINLSVDGVTFENIYQDISKLGEIMDYFFVTDYTLPDGSKAEGVSITYFEDNSSEIQKVFYKYNPKSNVIEKVEL